MSKLRRRIITTNSVKKTIELGKKVAKTLKPGDIVYLYGDLGSGKTVLAKGICQGLGVKEEVTSSSFIIATEYQGKIPIAHIDLYRLNKKSVAELPIEEYIPTNSITIIEWAERISPLTTSLKGGGNRLRIKIVIKGTAAREIQIEDLRN